MNKKDHKFIDLFAGIGGFHIAFRKLGGQCVFASEWDKHARETYEHNFQKTDKSLFESGNFIGDINSVKSIKKEIPDFDVLTGGFPCQPFSQAGHKRGFKDARGTLFFNIANIIKVKKPQAFFIENVRGLLKHNNGETFETIKNIIEKDLKYSFFFKVMHAKDFGVPQLRPRLFMVGFRDKTIDFEFPSPVPLKKTMSDIWGGKCTREVGFTLRVGGRGSDINDRRNWDSYMVDGEVRRLTPKEGKEMQGFPASFKFPVSDSQAMKQLGNSVAIPMVRATASEIIKRLS